MLPDIARPNKLLHVSGLGQYAGGGVLSRSFEDLHPETFAGTVVWNGTIARQEQKAEQRRPSIDPELGEPTVKQTRPAMEILRDIVRAADGPINVRQVADRCSLTYGIVEVTLRRLALRGELSVCEQLSTDGKGARRWLRVYSLPLKAKAA